jgi:sugar lactone lactonase YvrE
MTEETIFEAALAKQTPAERSAYLDKACNGDALLRRRIEALLEAHDKAGQFLDRPVVEQIAVGDRAPSTEVEAHGHDAADQSLDFLAPAQKPGALGRLGHYEVLEVVGRGGMGVVLKALDEKLHRVVAIKVMAPQLATNATDRKRFSREAQAAAVSHDHVVTLHGVDEANGLPYIVMHYVAGVSLQQRLDRTGPLGVKEILRIGMQTAAGLAAAHAQGLVHRDIKPANILLENGVERVKITDFGLARVAEDASLSQSGVVAGTPQYMAPEQARGEALDHRADLFSLGSVLYAMCTGRPPFRAGTAVAVLKCVCENTPRPIREINPEIPDWLCEIIGKLLTKEPAARFQSAAEVAEVLGRHLARLQQPRGASASPEADKPILPRTARRRRGWAAAAAVLLVLAAGLGMTEAGGVTHVVATVLRIARPDGTLVVEVEDPQVKVAIDGDDGELVLTGAGPQEVRLRPGRYQVRATKDGAPVRQEFITITRGGKQVVRVALEALPPERRVLGQNRPAPPTRPEATLLVHPGPGVTNYVCFTPDGRTLVVANEDGTVELWDPATRKERTRWKGPTLKVMDLALSPDGQAAATAAGFWDHPERGGEVQVWELASGQLVATYRETHSAMMAVAFAPDGKTLAVGSFPRGAVRLVDAATGKVLKTLQQPGQSTINSLAFTADGRTLVGGGGKKVGGKDAGLIRLWDVTTGVERDTWKGSMVEVQYLRFSPDGQTLAAACRDGTVRLWDVAVGRERAVLEGHNAWVHSLAFSPDGKVLACGALDGTIWLWDVAAGRVRTTLAGVMEVVLSVGIAPDGQTLAAGGGGWKQPGRVELWSLPDTRPARRTPAEPPAAEPFVLLSRSAKAEQKFATLAEAAGAAGPGDTIEIRGDGPFLTPPLFLKGVPLTIRAGAGFRPVIRLNAEGVQANVSLVRTNAPLALEGLELQRTGQAPWRSPSPIPYPVITVEQSPLYVANCRFVTKETGMALAMHRSALCQLRNCEFISTGRDFAAVNWGFPEGGRLVMENCVTLGGGFGLGVVFTAPPARGASARLRQNTLAAGWSVLVQLDVPVAVPGPNASPEETSLTLTAEGNVFDADSAVVALVQTGVSLQRSKALSPAEAEALLPGLLTWRGQRNMYPSCGLLSFSSGWEAHQPLSRAKNLADWKRLWGSPEQRSLIGQARYRGGNLSAKAVSVAELLTPADFRLRPGSPGHGAKDEGDLGADVDLVGPGAAYERWKKTPKYQEWLKAIRSIQRER